MPSQRVLLLTVGGLFAEALWRDVRRMSDARTTKKIDEWSPDDWPVAVCDEMDAFVYKIASSAFTPPVLYRSEHIDLWSMGLVYRDALVKPHPDYSRQLCSTNHEIIATRVSCKEQIVLDDGATVETAWLYRRINEAIAAWGELAEHRLIILIRSFIGALRTDEEVVDSLTTIPAWWSGTDNSDEPEPS